MTRFVGALLALTGLLLVPGPSPASADHGCIRAPWPSFREVAPTARLVVVGTVAEDLYRPGKQVATHWFRLDVKEVLRGHAPVSMVFESLDSGLPRTVASDPTCDSYPSLTVRVGDRIAMAFDGRVRGVKKRVTTVAFLQERRGSNPGAERSRIRQVRRLTGHAPDGSTVQPLPETTDELIARLVTEEVGPGVLRVLSDGHRELSLPVEGYVFEGQGKGWGALARSHVYRHVVAGPDGSVWILEPDRFFRLGRQRQWDWQGQPELQSDDEVEVAPDGTLWRTGGRWHEEARSFDGRRWIRHRSKDEIRSIEIEPDGTVWATRWRTVPPDGSELAGLARKDVTGWGTLALRKAQGSYGDQLVVTGRDEVWVCCKGKAWGEQQRLVGFDGGRRRVLDDPAPGRADAPMLIDSALDGSLWMRRNSSTLARHRLDGWRVFTAGEDGPIMGWSQEEGGFLRASPDGGVWVTVSTGKQSGNFDCDGLARFDGTTWSRYLPMACIFAIDIAADGTAWVQAARMDPRISQGLPLEPVQTYAIRPRHMPSTRGEATH
ncbi:hypothetical protein BH23CHL8_BH23CHL8_03180 [soil metagenome]